MKPSLRVMLADAIDYAGLFPPARLELDPAIRNFARYRSEQHAVALGRFVIPAAQLAALDAYRDNLLVGESRARIAALGRGGDSAPKFLENLAGDLSAIAAFNRDYEACANVNIVETKLPLDLLRTCDSAAVAGFLPQIETRFDAAALPGCQVFVECALIDDWKAGIAAAAAGISEFNEKKPIAGPPRFGMKVRTGGLEPSAFPTSEQVAFTIKSCIDHLVPLKFTAGLHHPIRRFDSGVRTMMHGFVNLFAAAVLGHAVALDQHTIQGIIDEQDARDFAFGDSSLAWNDAEAMIDEIRFARRIQIISFGSCSFEEPFDDLKQLGWM